VRCDAAAGQPGRYSCAHDYDTPSFSHQPPLGDGRSLYRVSLRKVPDQTQALQIAESLGSILRDPS